ncbi:Cytoplasmic axial filament protein CafA and Ribonuclease G [Anaerovibrio sp. JC8]|uniref:Rne/Rng family ribonuclease n=1 Tax=Anaerovibrio sp. JC8 TaxID=1240085 RepID=UPI000A0A1AA2|nr:Rne/Rng family ribonuclease [Anaerovibrio sp. JC8]ORU01244.1 Cytoplasmic axial filament protein CafA and Ribonuclease G [Anaerovibrio sp. JC8]
MKTIYVNVMPEETRMAVVEDGQLAMLELERPEHAHLVGNIYKGQVQNVLKGMQASFVDIGQPKNAFLYVGNGKIASKAQANSPRENITVGQNVIVQIIKDEVGTKGPRATMHLSIPGRHVVLMPNSAYIGTSHRIEDDGERQRLHDIVRAEVPKNMGCIIRTAAQGQPAENIVKDIRYLMKIWDEILAKAKLSATSALLYRDADLVIRIVRDYLTDDVDKMVIDNPRMYKRVCDLIKATAPDMLSRIELYEGRNIFKDNGITEAMEKLNGRTVELESGGFLVIDKTEAMTVIDVNTGSFVGDMNLADTVYKLNIEAADEIMRQLRLRDMGGIILVDFIDMDSPEQNERLLERMRQLAQGDRSKTNIVDITSLGLVEITRRKSRKNLESLLYCQCPVCEGTGRVLSPETLAVKISRNIRRVEAKKHAANGYLLQLHPQAANEIKAMDSFRRLMEDFGAEVTIEASREISPGSYILTQR